MFCLSAPTSSLVNQIAPHLSSDVPLDFEQQKELLRLRMQLQQEWELALEKLRQQAELDKLLAVEKVRQQTELAKLDLESETAFD